MNEMDLDSKSDKDSMSGHAVQISGRKRLASGLSNLGNTCFMNSTLQCLSNTEELRRYFLSGDYLKDLNIDNPLGTGGELATQFARLLGEMWGVPSKRRNVLGPATYTNSYSYTYHSAVIPRAFKACVGRHAEQFLGYDQHDSQEFATYLLDALHEDTNRVTKKPYVEKPEQGEDEPDDIAAEKSWKLHLQREDSHVLENFMGQVKSRLECCEPGCNRVSTTFDPFMYLSVPIPGSTEKTIKLLFVPLDPTKKGQKMYVRVSKMGKISDLLDTMNLKLCQVGFQKQAIPLHDLAVADVWNHDVYKWHKLDDDISDVHDTDNTVVYQLCSLEETKRLAKNSTSVDVPMKWESKALHRVSLDVVSKTILNKNDHWMDELQRYSKTPRLTVRYLNPKQTSIEERMEFHKKLENFLDECHGVLETEESGGLKRARDAFDGMGESEGMELETQEGLDSCDTDPLIQGLVDRCSASRHFCNLKTKHDFAVLEFCANKLRQRILQSMNDEKARRNEDMLLQVSFIKKSGYHNEGRVTPLALRIPGSTTVYEFRQIVADRVSRSLVVSHSTDDLGLDATQQEMSSGELSEETNEMNTGEPSSEAEAAERSRSENGNDISQPEQSELLIMLRAQLQYDRQSIHRSSRFPNNLKVLGMVEENTQHSVAVASDEAEQKTMDIVLNHGIVTVSWDEEYARHVFNDIEFESVELLGENSLTNMRDDPITVLDCITKYCQKEQLEESEMWYCNKCKNHVRAWKQFHLHRTPPYLIIHLKRFYFSSSSRRRDKISDFIDFPLEGLDLTELVADYDESTKPIYDCYAVSNHIGGLGGGHYTAYILSDDNGSWCYYNDSSVTEDVDKKEVVSAEAYVLYYRRRDVPVGQDKEYRITSNYFQSSPMICETVSPIDQRSLASSNNTAQAGDMDATLDDVASNSSSGAVTSPMGSVDNGILRGEVSGDEYLYTDDIQADERFPLQ
jgi:ubiquitin C-terminal hydrolase